MKKKSAIAAVVTALVVLVSAAIPALAQGEPQAAPDAEGVPRPALALRAPRVARVGTEVVVTVFARHDCVPVQDAGVWVLTWEAAVGLRAEVARLKEAGNAPATEEDYAALLTGRGELLEWTDEDGQVSHTFEDAGRYLLVAVKEGYFPGFAPVGVRAECEAGPANAQGAGRMLGATNRVCSATACRWGQPVPVMARNGLRMGNAGTPE